MTKRVTSWWGPSLRHCARARQLLLKKCRSSGEPLATLSPIWPAQDLNIRLPAPETKALLLDQQAGQLLMLEKLLKILDLFVDKKQYQKTLELQSQARIQGLRYQLIANSFDFLPK